jgi:sec-independent protein translocase protein TatC
VNNNSYLFNFNPNKQKKFSQILPDISFNTHLIELTQRTKYIFSFFLLIAFFIFYEVKFIVEILESPIDAIKFFQLSPGEYFIETLKIAFYSSLIVIGPFFLSQLSLFISPALINNEKKLIFPLILASIILFYLSLQFTYFFLIPAALTFFTIYSSDVIEPLLSFSQYCDFILLLFFTTAIIFQVPIFQIILGIFGFISGTKMIKLWKYVFLISVIISAILTPSTDPITQLLLSGAIIILYFLGAAALILIQGS